MHDSEDEKPEVWQPNDPLLEKIQNMILDLYEPAQNPLVANVRMSTREMYEAVYKLYPNTVFTEDMLAKWLHEKGFTFWDAGSLRFEWLLKSSK